MDNFTGRERMLVDGLHHTQTNFDQICIRVRIRDNWKHLLDESRVNKLLHMLIGAFRQGTCD